MLALGLRLTAGPRGLGAEPAPPVTEPTEPTWPTEPTDPTEPTETVPLPFETVNPDGWSVTAAAPVAALGQSFKVSRPGFTTGGLPVTQTETLHLTARLRRPHPHQAELTADQLALSDFLYQTDMIAGAENASTRPAPQPIAAWLSPDREILRGSSHIVRLAVAHAHARLGRPVAAVKFLLSDGSQNVEATVSHMSLQSYAASGLSVPHFAADLPLAGFADGAVLTLDAVIYPWVGAAFRLSEQASPYPSPNLSTLRLLCDRSGGFGRGYAYVDATLGTSAGVASANAETAAAAPFQTLVQATTALRSFHSTTYGRNFTDGGVIRLQEGVHLLSAAIRSPGVTEGFPLTIEAADPAKRATTILQDRGTTLTASCPNHLVLRDLTLRRGASGSIVFLDQVSASLSYETLLVLERCRFEEGGFGSYASWIHRCSRCLLIDCEGALSIATGGSVASANKTLHLWGCRSEGAAIPTAQIYGALGSRLRGAGFGQIQLGAAVQPSLAPFFGWNMLRNEAAASPCFRFSTEIGPRGAALVGGVVENFATSQPALQINADGNTSPVQNLVLQLGTVVGERSNLLYNDTGDDVAKSCALRGMVLNRLNLKSDLFSSATLRGNWAARYRVGWRALAVLRGDNNGGGSGYGSSAWLGEIAAPDEAAGSPSLPVLAVWAADRSGEGSNEGGGDYRPGPGHGLPRLPAGLAPYPWDLLGRPIPDDGSAVIGALQPVG